MKPSTLIIILITLTYIFVSSLWAIDIGASGHYLEGIGVPIQAEGLLFKMPPNVVYHMGLIIAGTSFLSVMALVIMMVSGELKVK